MNAIWCGILFNLVYLSRYFWQVWQFNPPGAIGGLLKVYIYLNDL
jgi:hypothetical protein